MTARADPLTKRAKTAGLAGFVRLSYPASSARVFVNVLERLNYSVDSLLSEAGIRRADLDHRAPGRTWYAEQWRFDPPAGEQPRDVPGRNRRSDPEKTKEPISAPPSPIHGSSVS
jgi:hypothetical protein